MVANSTYLGQDVGTQDDGVLFAQTSYHIPYLNDLFGVQSNGRLIQDDDRGLSQNGLGHAHPLPVALGQVSDQPFPDIRDFNQVHDLLYGVHTPWFRQFFNTGRKLQVFVHGHVHIQRRNLRQIPDAFFCGFRLLQYVVAVYDDLALCGAQITGHDVHGSGLPGAVRAQETVYLAVFHPET